MEIRSYRRVFDLERRIYHIDHLRLNPSGVPVRGVIYALAAVALALLCDRLPLAGTLAGPLPWFVRDIALPVACGSLLAAIRIDGRRFDQTAYALARYLLGPRRLVSLRPCRRCARTGRWRPPAALVLPDGSEPRLRRLRFAGPGTARLTARHEHKYTRWHAISRPRRGRTVVVHAPDTPAGGHAGRVIVLDRDACMRVA
jgi:hypothetical protein